MKNHKWSELMADNRRLFHPAQQQALRQHLDQGLANFTPLEQIDVPKFERPTQMKPGVSDDYTPTQEQMIRDDQMQGPMATWARQQFQLLHCQVSYHVQPPGGLVYNHVDVQGTLTRRFADMGVEASTDNFRHYIISLKDWQPGQSWMLHNQSWIDWRAGDVIEMPWYMPHATVNANDTHNAERLIVVGVQ